jgi:hypothetical protein
MFHCYTQTQVVQCAQLLVLKGVLLYLSLLLAASQRLLTTELQVGIAYALTKIVYGRLYCIYVYVMCYLKFE